MGVRRSTFLTTALAASLALAGTVAAQEGDGSTTTTSSAPTTSVAADTTTTVASTTTTAPTTSSPPTTTSTSSVPTVAPQVGAGPAAAGGAASATAAATAAAAAATAAAAAISASSKVLAAPGYNWAWRSINPPWVPKLPAFSGYGRRIVYAVSQQRLWAVEANGLIVKTHLVSGKLGHPAPGAYHVYSRSRHTFAAFNPSITWEYMVRFARGPSGLAIGFHQIPVRFGRPLQSISQLGQPLSGGCVRQAPADAIWVWNWAPIGTPVIVTP